MGFEVHEWVNIKIMGEEKNVISDANVCDL